MAIKVEALRLAMERGLPFVRTNNDSANAPMLAINKKLGFLPRPSVIGFQLEATGKEKIEDLGVRRP